MGAPPGEADLPPGAAWLNIRAISRNDLLTARFIAAIVR